MAVPKIGVYSVDIKVCFIRQTDRQTGYPSLDKPWLKYYPAELIENSIPEDTLYEYLVKNNEGHPEDIALNYFGKKYSYKWLFDKIQEYAEALTGNGIKSGDTVTVVALSSPVSVALFYAINLVGAVSNYVNVLLNEKEMRQVILSVNSKAVITLDLFADKILKSVQGSNVERVIVYSLADGMPLLLSAGFKAKTSKIRKKLKNDARIIQLQKFLQKKQPVLSEHKNPEETAFYGHTGGTTGAPKAVQLPDRSFNAVAWQYVHTFPHKRGDTFLSLIVPFVTYGMIVNIHMPLCLGLETILIPKFDAEAWPEYIRKYHPVHMCAAPSYISAMTENKKLEQVDLSCIQTVGMGGEGMNVPLENKINQFLAAHGSSAKILKGYGMTECCATTAVEYMHARKEGSVGIPFINNNFMVYDNERQTEQPFNQNGEICMQCRSYMLGYWEKNVADLVKEHPDGSRWIHTGDLGHIDEDGFVFIEGRIKRMILTINDGMPYKAFPAQTETVIDSSEQVRESCVVAWKMGNDIKLKAFLVLESYLTDSEKAVLFEELKQRCAQELSDYEVPVEFEVLTEFPRTAAGKIDYRSLEKTK